MAENTVVTLRMPQDLKRRLEREARSQGVSVNQLASYLLNIQLTQLETIATLDTRLATRSLPELQERVSRLLDKVPDRPIPEWDAIE